MRKSKLQIEAVVYIKGLTSIFYNQNVDRIVAPLLKLSLCSSNPTHIPSQNFIKTHARHLLNSNALRWRYITQVTVSYRNSRGALFKCTSSVERLAYESKEKQMRIAHWPLSTAASYSPYASKTCIDNNRSATVQQQHDFWYYSIGAVWQAISPCGSLRKLVDNNDKTSVS